MTDLSSNLDARPAGTAARGFTLVELLVVVAVIAMLVAILAPSLAGAREAARAAVCRSQLGGLARANACYAGDQGGRYVPAASDIFAGSPSNLHRWHGVRPSVDAPYDPSRGPMARYLGGDGRINRCPSFRDAQPGAAAGAYETGSGGYGYSDLYVGSTFWQYGYYHNSPGQRCGARMEDIRRPAETVMFADAATPLGDGSYVEESFAYCYFELDAAGALTANRRDPSLHFRHGGTVHVAWCDGHVDGRSDFHSITRNAYRANPQERLVGWFGPADNSLFDRE